MPRLCPALFLILPLVAVAQPALPRMSLSGVDLKLADEAVKAPVAGRTLMGNPIRIAGRGYPDGFGTWGSSRLELRLDGRARRFTAYVGITDDTLEPGPVWFEVIGDGRILAATDPMAKGEAARPIAVALDGVKDLVLTVEVADSIYTLTAWADAGITYAGAAPGAVVRVPEAPYLVTPQPGLAPVLTGARAFGARPGHPFLFTVSATGARPIHFASRGLPPELTLDPLTGQITGTSPAAGEYPTEITATNSIGTATRPLDIVIGDRIALTPPMGWNSWNCFASTVTADDLKAAADAFVREGLVDHGWTYVNVDDYWEVRPVAGDPIVRALDARLRSLGRPQGYVIRPNPDPLLLGQARDAQGRINGNRRFPDMPGLTAYIHQRGLKAGLYSSPGPLTCGQCTASYGHERLDAERFASWGFDYLKYDWCTYNSYAADHGLAEMEKPYALMGRELAAVPRDIVYSLCQYGRNDVWKWGDSVHGNCWRTASDIVDSWGSMSGIGFSQNGHEAYGGPGHWNDPDMLVVGWVGWGRNLHSSRLSPNEQYTHITLWSLLAAPLLLGCDLNRLDDFTRNLITNDEVLAVDQDSLGRGARRVSRHRDVEVWARPLADGGTAVGLFNRGELPARVTAWWAELGISGPQMMRDLWRQRDLGVATQECSAIIPRHGVLLLKLTPAPSDDSKE